MLDVIPASASIAVAEAEEEAEVNPDCRYCLNLSCTLDSGCDRVHEDDLLGPEVEAAV